MAKKTGSRHTPRLEARNKAKVDVRAILKMSEVVAEHVGALRGAADKMVADGFDAEHEAIVGCYTWCDATAKENTDNLVQLEELSERILVPLESKTKWVDIELEVVDGLLALSLLEGTFLALVANLTVKMQEIIELFPDETKEDYLASADESPVQESTVE